MIEGEKTLQLLKFAIKAGVQRHAYNGIRNPELDVMFAAATEALAAMSGSGQSDGPEHALTEDCSPTDLIDSATAARILGVTRRQAVRLGATLDGTQLPNGNWTFHRGTVEDYARERQRERSRSTST